MGKRWMIHLTGEHEEGVSRGKEVAKLAKALSQDMANKGFAVSREYASLDVDADERAAEAASRAAREKAKEQEEAKKKAAAKKAAKKKATASKK